MKDLVLDRPVTLVGVGCSHTQGSAFSKYVKDKNDNIQDIEWATEQLANKYKVPCTRSFVTNNLTWMAKLKDYIKIKKILNFGYGGLGTTSSITAVKNYITKNISLENHLFIFQLQDTYRNEIYVKNKSDVYQPLTLGLLLGGEYIEKELNKKYFDKFVSEKIDTFFYLRELFYLQNILEKLGAQVRIFGPPFYNIKPYSNLEIKDIKNILEYTERISYEKTLQNLKSIEEVFSNLNIINTDNMVDGISRNRKRPTLENENLVENDLHFSETGNAIVAEYLFKNFNNKEDSNIFYEKTP